MCRPSFLIIKTIVLILPLLAKGFPNAGGILNPVNDNINLEDIIGVQINSKFTGRPKKGQSCTTPNGNQGTCSNLYESQCSNVLDAIQNWRSNSLKLSNRYDVIKYLRQAIRSPCGFEQSDYTLCCSNGSDKGE